MMGWFGLGRRARPGFFVFEHCFGSDFKEVIMDCVVVGCGRVIHPERLAAMPRVVTCSHACSVAWGRALRNRTARRCMARKRAAAKASAAAENS